MLSEPESFEGIGIGGVSVNEKLIISVSFRRNQNIFGAMDRWSGDGEGIGVGGDIGIGWVRRISFAPVRGVLPKVDL